MSGRVVLLAMLASALSAGGQTLNERASDRYDVDMHFYLDSVGQPGSRGVALRLPGTLNGRRATFTLDTGASVSVVSPRLLDRYGLHPTADSTLVEGTSDRTDIKCFYVPATGMANENGLKGMANIILAGKMLKEIGLTDEAVIEKALKKCIPPKKADKLDANKKALKLGMEYAG